MRSGFIKIHRSAFEHRAFAGEEFSRREAWFWMISQAAWQNGLTQRGQFFATYRGMASTFNWSVKRVRCFLEQLQGKGMIVVSSGQNRGTERGTERGTPPSLITICNYEKYQSAEWPEETQTGTQRGPNKEIRNKNTSINGTRIDRDWLPNPQTIEAMSKLLGYDCLSLLDEFIDYWTSQPGQKGVKADWEATFRNWCRRSQEYGKRPNRTGARNKLEETYERNAEIVRSLLGKG